MKITFKLIILLGIFYLSFTSCNKEKVQPGHTDNPVELAPPSAQIEADFIKYILEKLTYSINFGNLPYKTVEINIRDNTISSYYIYKNNSADSGKYEYVLLKSGRHR
jgi:hypothetical protein